MIVETAILAGAGGLGVAAVCKFVKAITKHHNDKLWKIGSASHLEQPHLGEFKPLNSEGKPQSAKDFFGLFG